jgi:hypothetical protein
VKTVRSFISNSDSRKPTGHWPRTWLLTVSLVVALLGGWEAYWRSQGWLPMIVADQEAWVLARLRVQPTSTVLVGSSRTGAALDPLVWAATLGTEPPVMLAVEGESSLPVLADLAADTTFHGIVVAEMMPMATFMQDEPVGPYVAAAAEARQSPAKRWEARLRLSGPSHLVFRRPELQVNLLLGYLLLGGNVHQVHYRLRKDLFRPIDFRTEGGVPNPPAVLDTLAFTHLRRWGVPLVGAALDQRIAHIAADVKRIQQRGGTVVFLLFSGCGGRKAMEETLYPRSQYWDRLAEVPGVRMIDTDAYPEIGGLPCYDGSHIDTHDAPAVTRRVAHLVTDKP